MLGKVENNGLKSGHLIRVLTVIKSSVSFNFVTSALCTGIEISAKGVWKTLSDGDEVIVQGQDINEETPEQLELERKRAEMEETQKAVWVYIRGMLQNLGQDRLTKSLSF